MPHKTNQNMLSQLLKAELLAVDPDTEFCSNGFIDGRDAGDVLEPYRNSYGDSKPFLVCPVRLAGRPGVALRLAFNSRAVRGFRTKLGQAAKRAAARWRAEVSCPRPPDPSRPFHEPELVF